MQWACGIPNFGDMQREWLADYAMCDLNCIQLMQSATWMTCSLCIVFQIQSSMRIYKSVKLPLKLCQHFVYHPY